MRPVGGADLEAELEKPVKISSFEARAAPELQGLREEIRAIEAAGGPVLVGPFTGEVGFELLYWIPLLRWAVREFPGLRGRLVVVSRGGTQWWHCGLDARYVDLFEISSVADLVERRESLKQRVITPYEEELFASVSSVLGIEHALVLHVSLLFNFYYRIRKMDQHGFARSVRHSASTVEGLAAAFEPLPKPPLGPLAGLLPDEFIAVRFYFRPSFPDTAENRAFAAASIEAISQRFPVVLLNNSLELDDHADFSAAGGERVVAIDHLMQPRDNLHIQTIAMSRASAFVGTYGGLAYLAPFLGVPSIGFSSLPEHTHPWHLELAQNVARAPGFGSIVSLRPSDLQLLDLVGLQTATSPR